jgi:putative flippase GtrA/transcriptional regulator with XRE-family HTH domain
VTTGSVRIERVGHARVARVMRLVRFGIVGASGIVVNELAIAGFVSVLGLHYLVGFLLATQVSTLWNYALIEVWAFRGMKPTNRAWHRFGQLWVVNNVANVLTAPIFVFLTSVVGINYLVSNLMTLTIVFLGRFAIAEHIWSPKQHVHHTAGGVVEDAIVSVVGDEPARIVPDDAPADQGADVQPFLPAPEPVATAARQRAVGQSVPMAERGPMIRRARKRAKLSRNDLARRSGTPVATITAYEKGRRTPSLEALDRILVATRPRVDRPTGERPDPTLAAARLDDVLDLGEHLPRREPTRKLRYPRLG